MPDDEAADIINAAAARPRIEVKGVELQERHGGRKVTLLEVGVPACEKYPAGASLYIQPRQLGLHRQAFPGLWIIREITRVIKRSHRSGMKPEGHRSASEIVGSDRTSFRSDE